ncbi:MAG: N-acetylmuramoyl-L-alanine amidase [Clostridia bacterium]|nr:N-acetylmuramoyl-L-alanine amidase [Clostridia bacterium]
MKKEKKLSPARYTLEYLIFAVIFSLSLILMLFLVSMLRTDGSPEKSVLEPDAERRYPTVIIDAGHGGEDGGAIGKNGIYEKELNLAIAQDLAAMLRSSGIDVVMTRETDILLYDRNTDYRGRKKMLDLAARVKIAESYENCIFVSIHMNSFPQEKYSGLQVYYSANTPEARSLAESIQSSVQKHLQKDNNRKIKQASSNIFLLDRIKHPAVLVECGFLSNSEECALLSSEEYRQKLTLSIFCGITEYISEDNT